MWKKRVFLVFSALPGRRLALWALLFSETLCGFAASPAPEPASNRDALVQFGHVALQVKNINECISWYKDVMGMRLVNGPINIDTKVSPQHQWQEPCLVRIRE